MQFDDNTPRSQIVVAGASLTIARPFAEGHQLTANEANAMNQLLAENARNNFASTVQRAICEAVGADKWSDLSAEQKESGAANVDTGALQGQFDSYVGTYEFGVRSSGGGQPADPVEREALRVAKDAVIRSLKAKGYNIKEVKAAQITELAKQALADDEKGKKLRTIAKKIVDTANSVVDVDDLAA